MSTEKRIDAVVAVLREALKDEMVKHQSPDKKAMKAKWGSLAVEAVFYPTADGMPPEVPDSAPSVLVMPVRGELKDGQEQLQLKLLLTIYEPGDRQGLAPDQTVELKDLTDRGAGWRALTRILDRMRVALRAQIPDSDLSVEEMRWSVYTEEGLILDLRPFYVGWVDLICSCGGDGTLRSAAVDELLN